MEFHSQIPYLSDAQEMDMLEGKLNEIKVSDGNPCDTVKELKGTDSGRYALGVDDEYLSGLNSCSGCMTTRHQRLADADNNISTRTCCEMPAV